MRLLRATRVVRECAAMATTPRAEAKTSRATTPDGWIVKGPKLERDGCVAWRIRDPCALVERRFGVVYSESGMLRLVKGLDLSRQKARPAHPGADPKARERFKKPAQRDAGGRRPPSRGGAGRALVRG